MLRSRHRCQILAKRGIWDVAVKKLSGITGATAKETSEPLAVANYMGIAMEDSAGAFAKFSKMPERPRKMKSLGQRVNSVLIYLN